MKYIDWNKPLVTDAGEVRLVRGKGDLFEVSSDGVTWDVDHRGFPKHKQLAEWSGFYVRNKLENPRPVWRYASE